MSQCWNIPIFLHSEENSLDGLSDLRWDFPLGKMNPAWTRISPELISGFRWFVLPWLCWLGLLVNRALWMVLSLLPYSWLFNICITDRVVWLLPSPLLFLPTWKIIYFVRKKSILEIAYFINCLVTQRGWLLFSCLIYFKNFAAKLTLINELSVVSNKLCVGYIDWEGF